MPYAHGGLCQIVTHVTLERLYVLRGQRNRNPATVSRLAVNRKLTACCRHSFAHSLESESSGIFCRVEAFAVVSNRQINLSCVLLQPNSHHRCISVFVNICERFLHNSVKCCIHFLR